MTDLIPLTEVFWFAPDETRDRPTWINPAQITRLRVVTGGTMILFANHEEMTVRQTVQQIIDLLSDDPKPSPTSRVAAWAETMILNGRALLSMDPRDRPRMNFPYEIFVPDDDPADAEEEAERHRRRM